MSTSWQSQQGNGQYSLQFETTDKEKYKVIEKTAQMLIDGKTLDAATGNCETCIHKEACRAWINHGTTLYSDYHYSVEDCPHYTSEKIFSHKYATGMVDGANYLVDGLQDSLHRLAERETNMVIKETVLIIARNIGTLKFDENDLDKIKKGD